MRDLFKVIGWVMIFISRDGETFFRCEAAEVRKEGHLQQLLRKLLEENVDIIMPASKEEEEPSKFIYITREFSVSSGSIDLLGIDDKGAIYLIETKLYRSSERRKALAQVIEYASALWSEYSHNSDNSASFILKLKEKEPNRNIEEQDERNIKQGIEDGNFRLIVAMDQIDQTTERMIDFLNEMCDFEVYGLSLEVYKSEDGFEAVVPKLYPQSPPEPRTSKRRWNETSFFEDAKERIPEYVKSIEEIYRFSYEITAGKGGLRWGSGKVYGSFRVYISNLFEGKDMFMVSSPGYLTICFACLYPQELSDDISEKIAEIVDKFAEQLYNTGLLKERISHENYTEKGKQYPSIKVEQWANKISEFKEIIKELITSAEKLYQGKRINT
jgi:hypothetical protein